MRGQRVYTFFGNDHGVGGLREMEVEVGEQLSLRGLVTLLSSKASIFLFNRISKKSEEVLPNPLPETATNKKKERKTSKRNERRNNYTISQAITKKHPSYITLWGFVRLDNTVCLISQEAKTNNNKKKSVSGAGMQSQPNAERNVQVVVLALLFLIFERIGLVDSRSTLLSKRKV